METEGSNEVKTDIIFSDTREQIASTRREVDEVKGVMANNIEKIRERDDRLNNLQGRTADLENGKLL